nr:GIY-YIG nuclease family protein [Marinicella sp. W31]MDC2877029.1 GIY-YIG nuclease family protein [Marinicella sp. W31]
MPKVFFTYVWGPPGEPCWPLTFSSKGGRTQARNVLSDGDYVFTIGTRQQETDEQYRGRVLGLYQVTTQEVNTRDYIDPLSAGEAMRRTAEEFAFALHPALVWEITDTDNDFGNLVGSLPRALYYRAQTGVAELSPEAAERLLVLTRRPVRLAEPTTLLGQRRIQQSRLAPKHEGEFSGRFGEHETWFVYVFALHDRQGRSLAFKIGYASDPEARRKAYQFPMAEEVTGLRWKFLHKEAWATEDDARSVEQALLKRFSKNRLVSNGEIIHGLPPAARQSAGQDRPSGTADAKLRAPPGETALGLLMR